MELKRRLALSCALLSAGLGAGHFVQSRVERPVQTAQAAKPVNVTHLAAGEAVAEIAAPQLPQAAPALPPVQPQPEAKAAPTPAPEAARDCTATLVLAAQPSAMLGLTLLAPCQPDQRVVLRHAGLAVTGRTSVTGALFLSLPAMAQAARVSVLFGDGTTLEATADVPDLARLQRFAVQWMDRDTFQLHAFENGADYGQPGHVWAGAAQLPPAGAPHQAGFLTEIGDATVDLPMLAQVYTWPAAETPVDIVVETSVTEATCGRELLGETLTAAGGEVTITDLTVAMPDCAAMGDILVLKNLVPDMTLAAN